MIDLMIERRWFKVERKGLFRKKTKDDKKILRSIRIIEDAKEQIKLEKKNIRERRREEFRKTKFYKTKI